MIKTNQIIFLEKTANLLGVFGICLVMFLTFSVQFSLHELPCPLCLLQRFGFFCMAFGFLLNLRYGSNPLYYGIVLMSGLLTSFIALRQIVLHIIPGTGEYGSAILGLHLYTWSYIISMAAITISVILLSMSRYNNDTEKYYSSSWHYLIKIAFAIVSLLLFANIVSTFLMCGFASCSHDPVRYELLQYFIAPQ